MRLKILFVHSGNETFTELDRKLLNASFDVQDFLVSSKFPTDFLLYLHGIKNADVIFCWFASWNSFWALLIARFFRKPCTLVIGGYDVADLPIAKYGHQRGGLKKKISRWAMGLADRLIPFSKYSKQEAETNVGIPAECMNVIYIGVPDVFGSLPAAKEHIVLTVGKVEWANLKRKGLEPFVRAANYLPDIQFVVVGALADDSVRYLRSFASPNVVFTGRVNHEELLNYYRRASVYVQASLHEGFGLSVAEAMLAGCIPVITSAGSLPEVVGNCGLYTHSPEPWDVAKTIENALNSSSPIGEKARERILNHFPMEKRQKLLEETIWSLYHQRKNAFDN